MADPITIGLTAAKFAPFVAGLFGGGGSSKGSYGDLVRFSDSLNPRGELGPQDYAGAERTRSRLAGSATESARGLRLQAMRRARQRGLNTAPITEATQSRIGDIEAGGRERAGVAAEEQLENIRLGRERFGQQKALALLGGRINEFSNERFRDEFKRSTFLNSLLELTPSLLKGIDSLMPEGTTAAGGVLGRDNETLRFNEATGQYEADPGPRR